MAAIFAQCLTAAARTAMAGAAVSLAYTAHRHGGKLDAAASAVGGVADATTDCITASKAWMENRTEVEVETMMAKVGTLITKEVMGQEAAGKKITVTASMEPAEWWHLGIED
mgnify:CR=1 FL=1|jgi:hypothetical protein